MKLCISLAKKGYGKVKTNPLVGCVITKDNKIVATGYHRGFGEDHAEVDALKKINFEAEGCTLYANLEPCCHYGKTPPCVNAIIKAKVARVVMGMEDPNEKVNCAGIACLRKNKIQLRVGVLKEECKRLNESYIKFIITKKPFIALKIAMSLNGKIGIKGKKIRITNKESHFYSHHLRNRYDAIMVGINTILNDDPFLTCRIKDGNNPLRIILDSKLRIPLDANVLKDNNVIVAATEDYDEENYLKLKNKKIKIIIIKKNKDNQIDLRHLVYELGKLSICSVLVEGGSSITKSVLKENVADKLYLFVAPNIIIDKNAVSVFDKLFLKDLLKLKNTRIKKIKNNVLIRGYLR